ncbi:MAG: caspase family protein [Coleofasciculaceae cyanobacterium SM2_3_26]|nr:caspase family protein [Coleofasciculaceae cyanobacterium SM2_3_26]
MTQMKRRHFLQFAGSALATLGLSTLDLQQQASRYGGVLAQGTPRKLALLVGINEYPKSKRFSKLEGCLTDVELQRHLLIHRFGFNHSDIEILTDAQATRDGVVTAFQEHLINQARPGDVVVFHFSGHGSRIVDRNPIDSSGLHSTLVMADDATTEEIVDDIPGQMLYLMMAELAKKTET